MSSPSAKPCSFSLDGVHIEGLRWGEGKPKKVIALHGWLDNAASFSMIAPHLENLDLVALDLAGHGLSGMRAGCSAYNIWQDLIEIEQIARILQWPSFSLLGHSRGAMIATLYAGSFPKKVDALCLIDAIAPLTLDESEVPQQLAAAIDGLLQLADRRSSFYDSYDRAATARMYGAYPLSEFASRLLAERSVREKPGEGFYWHYDKRLLVASEFRMSEGQAKAFVDAFPCVATVIAAKNGLVFERGHDWYDSHPNLNIMALEGEHHLQLSADSLVIDQLIKVINERFSNS